MPLRSSTALFVVAGLLLVIDAAPAAAQSRIAILDATGISVLDTTSGQVRARFELPPLAAGERPLSVTATSDGARLLVATSSAMYVLDAVTGDVIARVPAQASVGKPAVLPDDTRAFMMAWRGSNYDANITIVDLSTFTTHVYNGLYPCRFGGGLVMHPGGDTLYVRCLHLWFDAFLRSVHVTATGFEGGSVITTGPDVSDLSVSPDGTRLFVWSGGAYTASGVLSPALEVYDSASLTLLHSYALNGPFPGDPLTSPDVRVSAQSASRVFVRLTDPVQHVVLIDVDSGATLGEAAVGGALVTDRTGALTFALAPTRLSRLDNDTAAPTTIATGPGGWLDATVLTDTCPLAVTTSARLFTTAGGTGTLTIDAAPSCVWTVDASDLPGLSFSTPSSGQGSQTLDFSLAPAAAPQRGALHIGPHPLTLEQTLPLAHIDAPAGGAVRQPFTLAGWAIDLSATPPPVSPTVALIHVWAWPADGGAPIWVGATGANLARPDVAAIYGSGYAASGFELAVRGLPPGLYTIVAYAQSARAGTFAGHAGVVVSIEAATLLSIDLPAGSVPRNFVVSGWAIDPAAVTGPGVDAVHVWAYPAAGGAPIWVGAADYGGARVDLGALFGPSFEPSSYWLFAALPPGDYTLAVFARSTVTGMFTGTATALRVVADAAPDMAIDNPATLGAGAATPLANPFHVGGWALDRGAAAGSGVDAVHVWAFPIDGGAPQFVGVAAPTLRPDVAGIFGPAFVGAGFLLTGATLPPGTYDLAVFARSTVTQSFNNWRVVRVTVP